MEPRQQVTRKAGVSQQDDFKPIGPVDWALGTALVESLVKPLHYALFPDSLDPRDWMTGAPAQVTLTPKPDDPTASHQDYWFDFIADSGDSDAATYLLARLFEGDVHVADPEGLLRGDSPVLPREQNQRDDDQKKKPRQKRLEVVPPNTAGSTLLPRGDFLFLGGDTAYPVADAKEIEDRFMAPMNAAWKAQGEPAPRPLLGIPGNHDWYDSLDGFNRVFRLPATRTDVPPPDPPPKKLAGYFQVQQASYFSLSLPGGWEIWALDARDGDDIDFRQAAFFDAQAQDVGSAKPLKEKRLILATPNPPFVNGEKEAFTDRLFAELPEAARKAARLWFSGDTHHYERFSSLQLKDAPNLTGIVSGLGGAVLHAAMSGSIEPDNVHPPVEEGSAAVWKRLAWPPFMLRRWGFMVLGLALGIAFAAGALEPSGEVGSWVDAALGRTCGECRYPLVLALLVATVGSILLKVLTSRKDSRKEAESKARARSKRERALWIGLTSLVPPLTLVAIAHFGNRSFGGVMADVAAELAFLLLLVGAGVAFVIGLPRRSPGPVLAAAGIAILLTGISLLVALTCGLVTADVISALDESTPFVDAVRSVVPSLAGGLLGLIFPLLAGYALIPAFALGSQRPFISSFAAVDRFQAFIRFRLRVPQTGESSLTGFVIASTSADDAKKLVNGGGSAPAELIDVFTLR